MVLLTSAVLSLPPYDPVVIAAGLAGIRARLFPLTALPGRFTRFAAPAAAPAWFPT